MAALGQPSASQRIAPTTRRCNAIISQLRKPWETKPKRRSSPGRGGRTGESSRAETFSFAPLGLPETRGLSGPRAGTLGYLAGSALRAFSLAYQYVQKRATNQEKCPGLHFYVAHRKKVWRLIQTPVCGKKEVTSKSAKAFDYVVMLRFTDGRSS